MRPLKRFRPWTTTSSSIRASYPSARMKSDRRTSGRSIPGEDTSSRYSPAIGFSRSSTGESARLPASQSSTVIVPSVRSAMICNVAGEPISFTRTSRKPRSVNTGAATCATRAAIPVSVRRRGSSSDAVDASTAARSVDCPFSPKCRTAAARQNKRAGPAGAHSSNLPGFSSSTVSRDIEPRYNRRKGHCAGS